MTVALFFEMRPRPGHMAQYFEHAARLKPRLAGHPGLVFLDRYRPQDDPGAILSHQLWADAAAIDGWRADPEHRRSQAAGRALHFAGYRIRVGRQILHLPEGAGPWSGAEPPGRFVAAAYGSAPVPLPGGRAHESVTLPGRHVTLAAFALARAAAGAAAQAQAAGAEEVRLFRILRDYTMHDRAEAPR